MRKVAVFGNAGGGKPAAMAQMRRGHAGLDAFLGECAALREAEHEVSHDNCRQRGQGELAQPIDEMRHPFAIDD